MTTVDCATYIAGLPRVLAGAALLLRDGRGHVLLVEPNHRDGWALPGGTIESDRGETPARRVLAALDVLAAGTGTAELENGRRVG